MPVKREAPIRARLGSYRPAFDEARRLLGLARGVEPSEADLSAEMIGRGLRSLVAVDDDTLSGPQAQKIAKLLPPA